MQPGWRCGCRGLSAPVYCRLARPAGAGVLGGPRMTEQAKADFWPRPVAHRRWRGPESRNGHALAT